MIALTLTLASALAGAAKVTITHYSDAQCPCSARVPQDVKVNFLDNAGFDGMVDFNQYFVGDLTKNPAKCIHGEEECVGQRHFACAQNMSDPRSSTTPPMYSDSKDCAAIEGPQCPCSNYTDFPEFGKNNVMEACAAKVGLNWTALHACGTGPMGNATNEAAGATPPACRGDGFKAKLEL
eukprot:gene14003-3831_t